MSQLTIAKYIMKAGRAAAQTKYGRMAVQKVEKLYDDYIKKLTKEQEQTKAGSNAQASVKREKLKKLGQGLVGGGAGAVLLTEIYGGRGDGKAEVTQRRAEANSKIKPYGSDAPKKTFKSAFADARAAGKKTFMFEGKKYTTDVAEGKKKEEAPKPKPKAKAPAKKSNVLSETDASTARSFNKGGYANCGASMKPNRMSRS